MIQQILFSLCLALPSVIIHALGLVTLLHWQTQQWPKIEANFRPRRNLTLLLVMFAFILALHLLEISIWAGFYRWQQCLPDFETSFYLSLTSYTTVGYGDIVLPRTWRLVGGLESLTGVLMLCWSAAFSFTIISRLFDLRIQKWSNK